MDDLRSFRRRRSKQTLRWHATVNRLTRLTLGPECSRKTSLKGGGYFYVSTIFDPTEVPVKLFSSHIFDKCHRYWASLTPGKYECEYSIANIYFGDAEKTRKLTNGGNRLSTPHPWINTIAAAAPAHCVAQTATMISTTEGKRIFREESWFWTSVSKNNKKNRPYINSAHRD